MNKLSILKDLRFGARVAEDETAELGRYFVETDQWNRISRGEVDIVRGDKGAGKSAIYSLLVSLSDKYFDDKIFLVSAEKPRGVTVFGNLTTDPPTSETEFISLWKLYISLLIGETVKAYEFRNDDARKLVRTLTDLGLIEKEFDLATSFKNVYAFIRRFTRPEVEATASYDPVTGTPTVGIKLTPSKDDTIGDRSLNLDDLLKLANSALKREDYKVWVLLDRLDVAFAENHELEANALRALFRVYRDMDDLAYIKLKIFIRSDIWSRITEGGFREASHITRFAILEWPNPALLNLIMRRLLSNDGILNGYKVEAAEILGSFESQETLFYRVFPKQVDQGTRKPSTLDWMITRCADGTGKTAPRELIHLLTSLRGHEIARLERGDPPADGEALFNKAVFKEALPDVSEARLVQSLFAEYPEQKNWISKLRGEKTEHTLESLAAIWNTDLQKTVQRCERLVAIGFFQRRGDRSDETYWVPFLYRDSLKMSQGRADDN